jgi:hypothetical protein
MVQTIFVLRMENLALNGGVGYSNRDRTDASGSVHYSTIKVRLSINEKGRAGTGAAQITLTPG